MIPGLFRARRIRSLIFAGLCKMFTTVRSVKTLRLRLCCPLSIVAMPGTIAACRECLRVCGRKRPQPDVDGYDSDGVLDLPWVSLHGYIEL
jgi:hypothetical protein